MKIGRKLIEFLAADITVLVYGPSRIDLIASLMDADWAHVVSDGSPEMLRSVFVKLLEHSVERRNVAERAKDYIEKFHEKNQIRARHIKFLENLLIKIPDESNE